MDEICAGSNCYVGRALLGVLGLTLNREPLYIASSTPLHRTGAPTFLFSRALQLPRSGSAGQRLTGASPSLILGDEQLFQGCLQR